MAITTTIRILLHFKLVSIVTLHPLFVIFLLQLTRSRDLTPGNFHPDLIGYFQGNDGISQSGDFTMDAATGDYLSAFLQVIDELLVLFGFFGLGPNEEKIKDADNEDDR